MRVAIFPHDRKDARDVKIFTGFVKSIAIEAMADMPRPGKPAPSRTGESDEL